MGKLTRKKSDCLGGVCLGLAEHWNTDPTLIRLIFLFLFFFSVVPIFWIYIILLIVIPESN